MKKSEFLAQMEEIAAEMDSVKAKRFYREVFYARKRGQEPREAIVTGWMVANGDDSVLATLRERNAGATYRADGMAEALDTIPSHRDTAQELFINFYELFEKHEKEFLKICKIENNLTRNMATYRFRNKFKIGGDFDSILETYRRYLARHEI